MLRIRTLLLMGLTAAMGTAGCVVDGDGDNEGFDLAWDLAYLDNVAVSCDDAGATSVVLVAQQMGTNKTFTNTFPCGPGRGISEVLPVGTYNVGISLRDKDNLALAERGGQFQIRRGQVTVLDKLTFQIQAWELSWSVARRNPDGSDTPSRCGDVGGKTVELIAQLGNEAGRMYRYACEDGDGITQAIRTGTYGVVVQLLGAAGNVLSKTDQMTRTVDGVARAILPPVVFSVRP